MSAVFKINDVISIHAPTRGATVNTYQKMNDIEFQSTLLQEERRHCVPRCHPVPHDFNPRSYKRSDYADGRFAPKGRDFNPRSYKRSDSFAYLLINFKQAISIHAPTRGATIDLSVADMHW